MKLIHIGDIHIKLSRVEEYNYVFKQLYDLIISEQPDYTIICGDIFDEKSAAEASIITRVSDFLTNIASRSKLIVIQGNHDTDVQYRSGELLTSLISIHKDLQSIHYFPNTGIYELDNIILGVLAPYKRTKPIILTSPSNMFLNNHEDNPKHPKGVSDCIHENKFSLGLFHEDPDEISKIFQNFDLVIGGHIHKRDHQYCGSLIKQTVAEEGQHGGIIWNNNIPTPFNLHNPYECLKISIINNIYPTLSPTQPNYWYIETDNDNDEFKEYVSNITKLFKKTPTKITVPKSFESTANEYDKIITDLLKDKPESIPEVIKIFNDNNKKEANTRNLINLQTLSFKNIFCFKEGFIDFNKFHGITGINASNETGKSSFLKIIIISIYGSSICGLRANDIIKFGNPSGKTEITIEFKDDIYKIIRLISIHSSTLSIIKNDQDISLSSKPANEKLIEQIFGNAESIFNASFIMQNSEHILISATPKNRREILANMLNLQVFSDKKDLLQQIAESNGRLQILRPKTSNKDDIEKQYNSIKNSINYIEKQKFVEQFGFQPLAYTSGTAIPNNLSVSELLLRKQINDKIKCKNPEKLKEITNLLQKYELYFKYKPLLEYKSLFNNIHTDISSSLSLQELLSICENYKKHQYQLDNLTSYEEAIENKLTCENNIQNILNDIEYYKSEISKYSKFKESDLQTLKPFDTDNDCINCRKIHEKCIYLSEKKEVFIENLDKYESIIINLEYKLKANQQNLNNSLQIINQWMINESHEPYGTYDISLVYPHIHEKPTEEYEYLLMEYKKYNVSEELDNTIEGMIFYHFQQRDQLKKYESLIPLNELQQKLTELEHKRNEILASESNYEEYKKEIKNNETLLAYKAVTDSSGISSVMINKRIDLLTHMVNEIIGGGFEIQQDYSLFYNHLPASSASGYRKMIISFALNIALWKLTSGQIINGIFIDEGLSSCDSDNLKKTLDFLQDLKYLPDMPKHIIIISHNDKVKTHFDTELLIIDNTISNTVIEQPNKYEEFTLSKTDNTIGWCNICDPEHTKPIKAITYKKSHITTKKHIDNLTQ